MTGRVLLLSPSRGLGGGIERYVATLEWAFAAEGVECQRLDLSGSGAPRPCPAAGPGPGHPAARPRTRPPSRRAPGAAAGGGAAGPGFRRLRGVGPVSRQRDMGFAVAAPEEPGAPPDARRWRAGGGVSNFTAGALMRDCRATVLPPALSREWFDTLAAAAAGRPGPGPGIRLATAFRLAEWRAKGLPQLVAAVTALGRPDVRLTICGSGTRRPTCCAWSLNIPGAAMRPGLSDDDLARELAAADLFVLATQTRSGRGAVGEGFGLVLLEAQAAGTPVIAPAYGGSREAYVEGVTGVAPADESAEALTRTLHDLLKDPARLAWMGRHAAQWARQAFAPERYAQLAVRRLL